MDSDELTFDEGTGSMKAQMKLTQVSVASSFTNPNGLEFENPDIIFDVLLSDQFGNRLKRPASAKQFTDYVLMTPEIHTIDGKLYISGAIGFTESATK